MQITKHCFSSNAELVKPIGDLTLQVTLPVSHDSLSKQTQLQLSTWKGRVIVLFIFGPDCGTCKHLARTLSSLSREYSRDIECIGICVQTGCRERLPDFAITADAIFPLTYCSTRELCPALGIPKGTWLFYPTVIFIDQQQRLRSIFVGNHEFFKDPEANIRLALGELIPETQQSGREVEVSA